MTTQSLRNPPTSLSDRVVAVLVILVVTAVLMTAFTTRLASGQDESRVWIRTDATTCALVQVELARGMMPCQQN